MTASYQTDIGMCHTCRKMNLDCSAFDFKLMPVIVSTLDKTIHIVRCTEYERAKGNTLPRP